MKGMRTLGLLAAGSGIGAVAARLLDPERET